MMKAILLVSVLLLGTVTLPHQAHAYTCGAVTAHGQPALENAAIAFFEGYLTTIGVYYPTNYGFLPSSDGCLQVDTYEKKYHRTGQADYFDAKYGTSCWSTNTEPFSAWYKAEVLHHPTTWQHYGWVGCFCYSNGMAVCDWI